MTHPPYVTLKSEYQVIVAPCAITALVGPLEPLYRVPPMVMKS